MLLRIDFTPEGQEALATGKPLYPWHFSLRLEGDQFWGPIIKGNVPVIAVDITLPEPEAGIANVLQSLADKEAELRNQLNTDLQEILKRRNDLLTLTMSPPVARDFFEGAVDNE